MDLGRQPNQYYLRLINPYDPVMHLGFEFYLPRDIPDPPEPPEYTIEEFVNSYGQEFYNLVEDGRTLNPIINGFIMIARKMIDWELLNEDEPMYKYLVSMFVGHHLEMALGRMKNQGDEISLTPEKPKEKKIEYKINKLEQESTYEATKYGFAFWQVYKPYLRFRHFGVYQPRNFPR